MNDLAMPPGEAEEAALTEAEELVRRTVRENGDRAALVRAVESILEGLPVPRFADRRISLLREVVVAHNPDGLDNPDKLLKLAFPEGASFLEPRSELAYLNVIGVVNTNRGRRAHAMQLLRRLLSRARELDDDYYIAAALINLGRIAWGAGLHESSFAFFRQAKEHSGHRRAEHHAWLVASHNLAYALFFVGRTDEAREEALHALSCVPAFLKPEEAAPWQYSVQDLHSTLAMEFALRGDVDNADAQLRLAEQLALRGGAGARRAFDLHRLAVRAISLRDARAASQLRQLICSADQPNGLEEGGYLLLYLACRDQGDAEGATDALERIASLLRVRLGELADELGQLAVVGTQAMGAPGAQIEAYVNARAAELRFPLIDRSDAWNQLLEMAVSATVAEDDSGLHAYRTAHLAGMLAQESGLPEREVGVIQNSALLHDAGKAAVPGSVLKSGGTSDRERALYESHATFGADLISRVRIADHTAIADYVRFHHAPYDGQTGLLAGEQLPLGARIVSVADAFDALVRGRPSRPSMSVQEALKELLRQRGRDYDPRLVDLLIALVRRIEREHGDVMAYLADGADAIEPIARRRLGRPQ